MSERKREPDPVKAFHRIRVRRDRMITGTVLLFSLILLTVVAAYFAVVGTETGFQYGITDKYQLYVYIIAGVGGLGAIIATARLAISFIVS